MSTAAAASARLSTGPRTQEGKQTSRFNAIRHGATSKTILLPGEDPARYEHIKAALIADLRPATEGEKILAERVAEAWWRRERIQETETQAMANLMAECGADNPADLAAFFLHPQESQRIRLLHRYLTAAERAYNKALADYRRQQKENRAIIEESQSLQSRWTGAQTETPATEAATSPAGAEHAATPDGFVSQNTENHENLAENEADYLAAKATKAESPAKLGFVSQKITRVAAASTSPRAYEAA